MRHTNIIVIKDVISSEKARVEKKKLLEDTADITI